MFCFCSRTTGRSLFSSISTSWNVPVPWSCWSSSVPLHRSETLSTYPSCSLARFLSSPSWWSWAFLLECVQLCVESCPTRHLTLMKAKLGSKEDREYYKQYCKDGVDFAKLVSCLDDFISHFLYLRGLKCAKGVLFFFCFCFFYVIQSPPELLRDGLCPGMLMPSKPCKLSGCVAPLSCCWHLAQELSLNQPTPSFAVTRRCLPALGTMKGGVVVVGNETSFDAGLGVSVNATDILEASKWVFWLCRTDTRVVTKQHQSIRTPFCTMLSRFNTLLRKFSLLQRLERSSVLTMWFAWQRRAWIYDCNHENKFNGWIMFVTHLYLCIFLSVFFLFFPVIVFLSSFLPSSLLSLVLSLFLSLFFPSFCTSFFPSFLPTFPLLFFLHYFSPFHLYFTPSFLPSFLLILLSSPSFLPPSFLSSFLPSFLLSFLLTLTPEGHFGNMLLSCQQTAVSCTRHASLHWSDVRFKGCLNSVPWCVFVDADACFGSAPFLRTRDGFCVIVFPTVGVYFAGCYLSRWWVSHALVWRQFIFFQFHLNALLNNNFVLSEVNQFQLKVYEILISSAGCSFIWSRFDEN